MGHWGLSRQRLVRASKVQALPQGGSEGKHFEVRGCNDVQPRQVNATNIPQQ